MNCTDKIKHTCGTKNYATCIEYQGTVSDNTTLTQTSCLDIENIAEDLYAMIDIVKSELNLTALTSECQTLPTTKNSVYTNRFSFGRILYSKSTNRRSNSSKHTSSKPNTNATNNGFARKNKNKNKICVITIIPQLQKFVKNAKVQDVKYF